MHQMSLESEKNMLRSGLNSKEAYSLETKFKGIGLIHWMTGALIRDDGIFYGYQTTKPEPELVSISFGDRGLGGDRYFTGEEKYMGVKKIAHDRYTPMGVVMYSSTLKPGIQKLWSSDGSRKDECDFRRGYVSG